jgi:cell division septum initiation protein DivIVA
MASNKQQAVDQIWEKYRRTLEMLDEALQENEQLKQQLDEKPKEIEVEKIVEVEADIDLNTPQSIAELEKKVEQKLSNNGQ